MNKSLAIMAVSAMALMGGVYGNAVKSAQAADNDMPKAEMPMKMQKEHKMMGKNMENMKADHKKMMDDHKMINDSHEKIMKDHKKMMDDHKMIMDEHKEMKSQIKDLQSK